jgi:HD-GYP domain-containing protein (c-di-GMP phosphodiesterase class II)/integral membrane sensor domain MASE1
MNKVNVNLNITKDEGQSGKTRGSKQKLTSTPKFNNHKLPKIYRVMKNKSPAPSKTAQSPNNPQSLLRVAIIIGVFLFTFIILDYISTQFQELQGVVAWYPPAGLTYALLLAFGVGFTPVITAALLISSIFIYRMPQPFHLLFLWAIIISLIYGLAAAFLRHRIHLDLQLRKLRDVIWFIFTIVLVSALLAVLSVLSSALSSNMPRNEILIAIFHWWIGETVGVLTVTPFLLNYVMPFLKQLSDGRSVKPLAHRSFTRPTLTVLGQVSAIALTLFWVFSTSILNEYRPLYLISLPLIWIALAHGFKGVTLGIMLTNFGVIAALWFSRFDPSRLSELQLLMIVNCITGLLMGAVVTQRKNAEKEMSRLIMELRNLGEAEKNNRVLAEALARNVIALNSSLKTDEILDAIIENINRIVPSDAINIMLIEGDHTRIVRSRGYQEKGLSDWIKQKQFILDEESNLSEIIRSKKYKITSNTKQSKDWNAYPEIAWNKSNIAVPILEDENVIGFVNVDSIKPDFYSKEHARQLMAFTDQVSTALKNARLFEATQERMNRMQAMTQIDQAINSSLDLNISLEIVLIQAKDQLKADAVDILLVNSPANSLVFSKATGFKTDEIRKANLKLGTGLPGKAVLERTLVSIPDLNSASESYFKNMLVEREGFISYYCLPLITKGQLKGVMEVYFRKPFLADQEWLEFLEMLAQQTAIAINNAELLNSLQVSNIELLNAYETTLKGWVDALDMRDHETEGHTQRVTELSLQLARQMGIKDVEIVNFERGALLHDIGKVAISDAILNKPGPLTDEEWVIMRKHPLYAFELLSKSKYLIPALDIPYCHHEKWDGTGYPRGLKGEAIPLAARIFSIVDVWDALTSDRPYRKAWTKKKALKYIREQSGLYFDPGVMAMFLNTINEKNT